MILSPVILEGRHVRLEPLAQAHHSALCAIGLDPELWEFIPYRVTTPEDMAGYIQTAQDHRAAGSELPFATVHAPSGQIIGSTRYMNIDRANRRVEIGATWITAPWRRTAVNTEAKYLMLRHAFETLGCTLRQHMVMWSGRLRDSVYFSVLDSEWPGVKRDLEQKLAF